MTTVLAALLSGLTGLVVSAIGTYLGVHWKVRKDLEAKYDESLRNLRLDAYCELWRLTKPLAAFRQGQPPRGELATLSTDLMNWYFDKGGLYLSKETRDACFALQRSLRAVLASHRWNQQQDQTVDAKTFGVLREVASELRSMMTYDVGTRRPFSMRDRDDGGGDWQPTDPKSLPEKAGQSERWIVGHWLGDEPKSPTNA